MSEKWILTYQGKAVRVSDFRSFTIFRRGSVPENTFHYIVGDSGGDSMDSFTNPNGRISEYFEDRDKLIQCLDDLITRINEPRYAENLIIAKTEKDFA